MVKAQTSQLSITMFQNMSEAYQLPGFLEFVFLSTAFFACKFANSHHASFTLYLFSILSHIVALFNHLCTFLCRFYSISCVVILNYAGVGRIFSRGASRGFSQNFFQGGPKAVKFVFYP